MLMQNLWDQTQSTAKVASLTYGIYTALRKRLCASSPIALHSPVPLDHLLAWTASKDHENLACIIHEIREGIHQMYKNDSSLSSRTLYESISINILKNISHVSQRIWEGTHTFIIYTFISGRRLFRRRTFRPSSRGEYFFPRLTSPRWI